MLQLHHFGGYYFLESKSNTRLVRIRNPGFPPLCFGTLKRSLEKKRSSIFSLKVCGRLIKGILRLLAI